MMHKLSDPRLWFVTVLTVLLVAGLFAAAWDARRRLVRD